MKSHSSFSQLWWDIALELCPALDEQWRLPLEQLYQTHGSSPVLEGLEILYQRKGEEMRYLPQHTFVAYLKGIIANRYHEHQAKQKAEQALHSVTHNFFLT